MHHKKERHSRLSEGKISTRTVRVTSHAFVNKGNTGIQHSVPEVPRPRARVEPCVSAIGSEA